MTFLNNNVKIALQLIGYRIHSTLRTTNEHTNTVVTVTITLVNTRIYLAISASISKQETTRRCKGFKVLEK